MKFKWLGSLRIVDQNSNEVAHLNEKMQYSKGSATLSFNLRKGERIVAADVQTFGNLPVHVSFLIADLSWKPLLQ